MTRPATRSSSSSVSPFSARSAAARTAAISYPVGKPLRQHRCRESRRALISRILNFIDPRGAATSTVSPFFLPMIALPTGDSFESLFSAGFASAEPTMRYSKVCFASMSRSFTLEPIETTSLATSFLLITRALRSRSSSVAIRCSSSACSFFASSYSAFSAMSPNSRAVRIRSATSRRLSFERNSISCFSFS